MQRVWASGEELVTFVLLGVAVIAGPKEQPAGLRGGRPG